PLQGWLEGDHPATCARIRPCRSAGELYYHVRTLDRCGVGLGHVGAGHHPRYRGRWPLTWRSPALDADLVAPHPQSRRIDPRLAGAHVEFPAVPGTTQDLPRPLVPVLARPRRRDRPPQHAPTERSALMGAAIAQGVELALDVEDADGAPRDLHDLALPR